MVHLRKVSMLIQLRIESYFFCVSLRCMKTEGDTVSNKSTDFLDLFCMMIALLHCACVSYWMVYATVREDNRPYRRKTIH